MPETTPETAGDALARTALTDRELLIHALQHLEILTDQMGEVHGAVIRLDGELSVFKPLLAKLAPGGKPDFLSAMQTRREMRRAQR